MASMQEGAGSVRERMEQALRDNPERSDRTGKASDLPACSQLVETRLRALQTVRDLEPRRVCYADRVRDLKQTLANTPGHSAHFDTLLEKLREARTELLKLEQQLLAASYDIRTTKWLVDLLADPSSEVAATAPLPATYD